MTYAFEFRLEGVEEGSDEAGREVVRLKGVSIPSFFNPVSGVLDGGWGLIDDRWRRRRLRAVLVLLGRWLRMGGSRSRYARGTP
jgi:hypothetical protein